MLKEDSLSAIKFEFYEIIIVRSFVEGRSPVGYLKLRSPF